MPSPLLEVKDVTKIFKRGIAKKHWTVALENFSLIIPGDTPTLTTIAGESGSGKSTLAYLVLGFLAPTSGDVLYKGKSIQIMKRKEQNRLYRAVQIIFQDPYEVYNPFYRIDHVFKTVIRNLGLAQSKNEVKKITENALRFVDLDPEEILGKYPHEFSGGQLQRIMVARTFLTKPNLIVADEPVSMIDASLRAKVLESLAKIKEEFGISFLYITHDLSTAYQISDNIVILYKGAKVESGNIEEVMKRPKHPYTQLLINSVPSPKPSKKWKGNLQAFSKQELEEAKPDTYLAGCKFRERCPHAMKICIENSPPSYKINSNHNVACYLYAFRKFTTKTRNGSG